ncbi:MAG: hypothetical protein IJJ06_09515 [Mogibacterium sp.]|nr:hypothetical protein [Mogibacterium sp.]
MRKHFNKITSLMLILCLSFGVFAVSTGSAYAKTKKWEIVVGEDRWVGDPDEIVSVYDVYSFENKNGPTQATVTSVETSDKSVLSVKKEEVHFTDHTEKGFLLHAKKAGKAKITVKYKKPSGKTGTLKKTIRVKKYPNEIKSLKVNGKTVKVSKNKFYYAKETSKKNVTVKMALNDGWKISDVSGYKYTKSGKRSTVKVTKSMIKKGKSISFPKKYKNMYIYVYLTDGKDYISYDVTFFRP